MTDAAELSIPVYRNGIGRRVAVVPPPVHRTNKPGHRTIQLIDSPCVITWQVPLSFLAGLILENVHV